MKLSDLQVAGLRTYVEAVSKVPSEEAALSPHAQAAFSLGKLCGKAELARELLEECETREAGKGHT